MISAFGVEHGISKAMRPNDVAVKLAMKSGDKASARFARMQEAKRIANQYGKQPVTEPDVASSTVSSVPSGLSRAARSLFGFKGYPVS